MPRIASDDVLKTIKKAKDKNRPFVVRFENAEGEFRTMTIASPSFSKEFVKGVLKPGTRQKEDLVNKTLTVFSLDRFAEFIAEGMQRKAAGSQSWRRIPLTRVHRVEVL